MKLFIALAAIALAVGWVILLGWLVTVIVGWFGPELNLWQGIIISFVISLLTGGSSAR